MTRNLSDSAYKLARETDRDIRRISRDLAAKRRREWWAEHKVTVLTVVVSFVAAAALVALQVWLP